MILICVFSILVLAIIARILKLKKIFLLLLFLSLSLFYLSVSGLLPKMLLENLQNDTAMPYHTEFAEKNAIVVLGGGYSKISLRTDQEIYQTGMWTYSRIVAGVKAYFSCKKSGKICFLILSGGDPFKTGHSESELYKKEVLALGVPERDLILESKSNNTFENAKFTAKIILAEKVDPNIGVHLITSGFHIKRATQYFSFFYISPRPVPSDYFSVELQFIPVSSKNLIATDVALNEYIGILRFYIYNLFGLNKQ